MSSITIEDTDNHILFTIFAICLCVFGGISSALFLFILREADRGRQNVIMLSLVFVCLLHDIGFVFLWSIDISGFTEEQKETMKRIMFILCTGTYQMFVFSLVAMTLDRHIAFHKPFKYHRMVTRPKIYRYYTASLLIVVCTRIPFAVQPWIPLKILFRIDILQETVLVLPQPFIYWRMYKHWKARSNLHKQPKRNFSQRHRDQQKHFVFVSLVICFTCFGQILSDTFYVLDTLDAVKYTTTFHIIMGYISNGLWVLVIVLTPLCHVTVKPSVKRYFRRTKLNQQQGISERFSSVNFSNHRISTIPTN